MAPQILFGCASIGKSYSSKAEVEALIKVLVECSSIDRLDTAARYPPTSPGLSEKLLGEAGAARAFKIDTKILVLGDGRGSHTEQATSRSIAQSYESLQLAGSQINILYCHAPDRQTPIAEQAAILDKFHREKKFAHLGVSNFSVAMLEEWLQVADKHGYVKPSYYQGQYNLLCRGYETNLFQFLRKHGIHFIAFSPLAGGFLTGKLTHAGTQPDGGREYLVGTRFEIADDNPFGKAFRHWYDKPSMHRAIEKLSALAQPLNVPPEALALRWLLHHSALREDDGIVFGASKVEQVDRFLAMAGAGPLPDVVVQELGELWSLCSNDAQSIIA